VLERGPGAVEDLVFAADFPSAFSHEVLDAVVISADGGPSPLVGEHGPFFVVVEDGDGAGPQIVGEIGGALIDAGAGVVQVGYSIVGSCWGRGYATAALEQLLARLRADPGVRRVVADTFTDHTASRRVMEKAGMRLVEHRQAEVDGEARELVVYEA
jgi:RimJ/RimL family protein N-acetyltransferase